MTNWNKIPLSLVLKSAPPPHLIALDRFAWNNGLGTLRLNGTMGGNGPSGGTMALPVLNDDGDAIDAQATFEAAAISPMSSLWWQPGAMGNDPLFGDNGVSIDMLARTVFRRDGSGVLYSTPSRFLTFSRLSSGTYFDAAGILQTAGSGVMRFDHDPVTGQRLGVLFEGARTNLLLGSDAPSTQNVTVTGTAFTLSFWGTGTITLSGASTAGPLVGAGANDRARLTFTPSAGTLTLTVSGDVGRAQLEASTFPSSYIKTEGSTVARAADICTVPLADIGYSGGECTIIVHGRRPANDAANHTLIRLEGADGGDGRFGLLIAADGTFRNFAVSGAGATLVDRSNGGASIPAGAPYKFVARFKGGDYRAALNGTLGTGDSAVLPTAPTVARLANTAAGTAPLNSTLAKVEVINRALSDTELQARSAL